MDNSLFRILLYLFVLVLSPNLLFSQQLFYENGSPSHPNILGYGSSTRDIIDLAGEWEYSLDNGTTWQKVKVPSATSFEGLITFRKKFFVSAETISRNAFSFVSYGMNYQAEIFINETFVGKHEGGYTSFELPIPENLIQVGGENVIRVVVDNRLNYRTTFPPRAQVDGWKNYGGITRDIFIVATPRVWISKADVSVEAIEPKATRLLVSATISAKDLTQFPQLSSKTMQLAAEVVEVNSGVVVGKQILVPVTLESNREVRHDISLSLQNAKLWSPETPEVYSVRISLLAFEGKKDSLIDETSITTGIRTIVKERNALLLNGAPVVLRGVVWIEDSEKHGSALTYEEMEKDVALIKNLGANAVRVAFNPPHPFFVALCDRYGLFVLQEIPNIGIPKSITDDEQYRAIMEQRLQEMINRDKHHPSVIAWGLGEMLPDSERREGDLISYLHQIAQSLDSRLTYAFISGSHNDQPLPTDIVAVNAALQDVKTFRTMVTEIKQSYPTKAIVIAGYGRAAETGNRNGYSDPNSQEAQARFLHQRYAVIREADIAGSMIFSFNDFRSDRPILGMKPYDVHLHTTGIVELDRSKKAAYDLVHSLFHDQKISALPVGTYVPPTPYVYVISGIGLLLMVAWLWNVNRRFRESTRRAIINSYNFFADIRDQFTLPLFHTTVTAVIIALTCGIVFSSLLHHFRSNAVLDYVLSYLLTDEIKEVIIVMAWNPLVSIAYFSAAVFVWFFVLTLLIQLFSKLARVKIRLFHSYSIAVWTSLPWTFLIPVTMILYRVLQSEPYVPWILGMMVVMSLWVLLRTLKGVSVIYHIYRPKMYVYGFAGLLLFLVGLYFYLDHAIAVTAYAEYFVTTILPSIN